MQNLRLNAHDLAWLVQEVNTRFDMKKEKRQALPIQKIVELLKGYLENNQLILSTDLVKKIRILSEERLEYYSSSRFGFIIQFFSSLINLWKISAFKSSGQLGVEYCEHYFKKYAYLDSENSQPATGKEEIGSVENDSDSEDDHSYLESIFAKTPRAKADVKEESHASEIIEAPFENPKQSHEEITLEKSIAMAVLPLPTPILTEDKITSEEEAIDIPDREPSPVISKLIPLTPKEEMLNAFQEAWLHAGQHERKWIRDIFTVITNGVTIAKWEKRKDSSEFSLEMTEEVLGTHPQIPIGSLVMKKKIKIVFSEEKRLDDTSHRKVVSFPDKGLCYRVGWGYLSKDTPLEKVMIDANNHELVSVEALGLKYKKSPHFILDFLKGVQWKT